jgi:hypothetical protein
VPIDDRWEKFAPSDWTAFADAGFAELREPASKGESDVGMSVVMMNFTSTSEQQWSFILAAVPLAESDDELGHIAAGPLEHLLGWHGEIYTDLVEQQAADDKKFARTLTGVWQYKMTEDVWSRIQTLQKQVTNPLQCSPEANDDA